MTLHGIDLHTDSLLDARLNTNDFKSIKRQKYYLTGLFFDEFKKSLSKDDYVLIEPCTNAFWLYDQVKPLVRECYILNTIGDRKINTNKTDKIDAEKLLKKLSYYLITNDKYNMPTIFVPNKDTRALRGLFSTYNLQKKMINQLRNRIHSILKENGVFIKREEVFLKRFRQEYLKYDLPYSWKIQLKLLFDQLDNTELKKEELKKEILLVGVELFEEEVILLVSITGVSIFIACAIMADVVDINRFSSVKRFCSYLRVAPKVKGSNDKNKVKSTNKASRPLTIALLSQSINHFLDSPYFRTFYDRVKPGKKSGVYRMALLRKVLVSAFHMLKNKNKYYWLKDTLYQEKLKDIQKIKEKRKTLLRA